VVAADLLLISGKTGTGKTRVIWEMPGSIDLEGLANHRGSTFGQLPVPQPTQIDFENALSIAMLKRLASDDQRLFLEDEGRLIGRLYLPETLCKAMALAPMLVVEQSLDERVDIVLADYIVDLGRRYRQLHGEEGDRLHAQKLQADLLRIRKRLGGERHQQVSQMMAAAFALQQSRADTSGHRQWVAFLLEQYYDPMYEYQLRQREGEVLFRGNRQAVLQWAAD
jgi:tRNA 2-selenouridine synthase